MVATYSQSIWSDSNVASAMAVTVREMVAKAPPLALQHSKSFGHFRSVSPDSDKKGENVAIWICIICQEPNEEAVSPRMCSFCGTPRTMLERKSSMIRRLDKEAEEERKRQRDRKAHDARLRARFKHLGLREHVCGDDGNCMFRAISHQLYRTEDHHDKLRATIVKYISNTPNDFAIYFESDQEFHSYCNELSRPGVWGDELTLGAASRCLCVEVHVITSNEERWFLTYRGTQCGSYGSPSSKEEDTPTAQIFLAYHSPVHYNSVIPEQFEPSLSIGKHVKKPETSTKTSSNGPHASIVIDEASPSSPLSRASSIYLHRAPSNSFMPTLYLGRQEPVLVHVRTQVPKYYLSTVGGTLLGATKDVTAATAFYLYVSRVSEEDFDVIDALNMRSTTSANGSPRSTSLTSSPNEILLHVSLQDARTGYFVKRLRSSSSPSSPKGPMERSDVTINLTNGDPLHALTTLLWNCKTGRLEFRVAPTSQPQYIHVSGPERKVYIVQSSKTPHDPFSTCSTESRTPSISQFVMEYVVKNDPHAKFCMFCGFIGSWGKEKGNNVCTRSPQRTHASLAV